MMHKLLMAFSPELRVADTGFNTERILDAYKKATNDSADLLILPELCVTGVSCGDLFINDRLLEAALDSLYTLAASTDGEKTMLLVSLPVRINGKVYEAAALLGDGEILSLMPRSYFNKCQSYKKRWFDIWESSGDVVILENGREVYCCSEIDVNNVTYSVCFDENDLCDLEYNTNVVVLFTSTEEHIGRSQKLREQIKVYSKEHENIVVSVTPDRSESTGKGVCSGYSCIVYKGTMYSESRLFANEFISTDFKDKTEAEHSDPDECELAVMIQAHALAQRLKKIWVPKIVLGISGGLDSTQALLAGVKALDILGYPRTNMIAVTMPCFGTTTRTKSNAQHISELCGTDFREISIRESVVQHLKDIGHDGVTADVAFENAQARERTQVLMDLANMENAIVLGTGDMSEAALGWCTYNGDHMSMYNVNCNMTKTFLRKVVRYEAEHCENIELSKVLLDVIDTPVSPELKPSEKDNISQKTEDILGPYEVLDYYLERFVKYHQSPTAIFELAQKVFAEKYDIEDLKKWLNQFIKRFFNNQFKRNCVPDGPRVIDYDLSPSIGWIMTSDTSNASFLNLV